MKTLRERDIAAMEVREKHREMMINYYIERRGGRVGEYSLLEQFLEVARYEGERVANGRGR